MLKKITALIVLIGSIGLFAQTALAEEGGTIIPETETLNCDTVLDTIDETIKKEKTTSFEKINQATNIERTDILACSIKTGRIQIWMIPHFITYLIEVLIAIAGAICMLFIVIGGYFYVIGGISEDKEKGKKTILYALIGLVVTLTAWIVINIIQVQVTS